MKTSTRQRSWIWQLALLGISMDLTLVVSALGASPQQTALPGLTSRPATTPPGLQEATGDYLPLLALGTGETVQGARPDCCWLPAFRAPLSYRCPQT